MNLPDKKYDIIYADPPWAFKNYNDATSTKWVGDQYNLMTPEEVKDLPVASIANDNSVLLLWATYPNLPLAIETMKSWGFKYKTVAFTWVKTNKKAPTLFTGMGYYTRSNAEIVLLGTRGKPLSRINHMVHSIIVASVRGHSQKPEETRTRIVSLFGDLPKIELFARERVDGWDAWGDEL